MTAWLEEAGHLLRLGRRDLQTFCILLDSGRAALAPICFHAQQAAEKALKAVLTVQQCDFPRTHSLSELARLVQDSGLAPPCSAADHLRLTPFAVEFRYDERVPTLLDGAEAGRIASQTLEWADSIVTAAGGA